MAQIFDSKHANQTNQSQKAEDSFLNNQLTLTNGAQANNDDQSFNNYAKGSLIMQGIANEDTTVVYSREGP